MSRICWKYLTISNTKFTQAYRNEINIILIYYPHSFEYSLNLEDFRKLANVRAANLASVIDQCDGNPSAYIETQYSQAMTQDNLCFE